MFSIPGMNPEELDQWIPIRSIDRLIDLGWSALRRIYFSSIRIPLV